MQKMWHAQCFTTVSLLVKVKITVIGHVSSSSSDLGPAPRPLRLTEDAVSPQQPPDPCFLSKGLHSWPFF